MLSSFSNVTALLLRKSKGTSLKHQLISSVCFRTQHEPEGHVSCDVIVNISEWKAEFKVMQWVKRTTYQQDRLRTNVFILYEEKDDASWCENDESIDVCKNIFYLQYVQLCTVSYIWQISEYKKRAVQLKTSLYVLLFLFKFFFM